MNINVRLSVGLAQSLGNPRLTVTLAENATVADLLDHLRARYPDMEQKLNVAVPMIAGRYASPAESLATGQDVALLLPVAGG